MFVANIFKNFNASKIQTWNIEGNKPLKPLAKYR
jgi:hypothetical protein